MSVQILVYFSIIYQYTSVCIYMIFEIASNVIMCFVLLRSMLAFFIFKFPPAVYYP